MINLSQFDLPKWPAILVKGKAVTKEQAMEIIIRTSGFYFGTNDKQFERQIWKLLGGANFNQHGSIDYNEIEKIEQDFKAISLNYLVNRRIASTWIGGTHGWCDWNGMIFCNN